ncbi:L-lactate dehydrogenase [Corynebacterium anserum]|uniref:L-lactate dehydrogenase n=1 Tax=Corynebacterium anserum TaxID=2684406 RepID=A0A7G7YLK7_9CORY|nr:L-lactate dehydrogenase [Corynebacterium anserum]MBC2681465.1 L-lactate dehydrogenase [Corynebacterium anserum]QNH95377.1 L-lactate dehydrogenase [Corynebacterium anserum]
MTLTTGAKIVLIGAGDVGIAYAYALVNQGLCDHLAIIDINERKTWGHVQDLNHAVPWGGHSIKVTVGTYEDCADAAMVVNCAGVAQKPGETRLDLVGRNVVIFKDIVGKVMDAGFNGVFVVATNPVDVLSYATWKMSGLPSHQVIGSGTILDTARYRYALGRYFDLAPTSVHAYVIGEHGDTELPVLSAGSAGGVPLKKMLQTRALEKADTSDADKIFEETRDAAYEIIQAKGSTSFGIGMGLARITRAILHNQDVVLPVSALLEGHYGLEDIYIGTPAVIDRRGIRHVVELDLDDDEAAKFQHSADILTRVMQDSGLRAL